MNDRFAGFESAAWRKVEGADGTLRAVSANGKTAEVIIFRHDGEEFAFSHTIPFSTAEDAMAAVLLVREAVR